MFGKLRRPWRRFRYNNQAKYPAFFRLCDFFMFPAQVAVLAAVMWVAVDWYTSYMPPAQAPYSDPANNAAESAPASNPSPAPTIAAATDAPDTPKLTETLKTLTQTKTVAPLADPLVIDPIVKARANADHNAPVSQPIQRRANTIANADWVLQQQAGFVIQVSSSERPRRLEAMAKTLGLSKPAAIYPFKTTASGIQLYGLSAGHYDNYTSALLGIRELPDKIQASKPWIRSIQDLKKDITAIRETKSALLQTPGNSAEQ